MSRTICYLSCGSGWLRETECQSVGLEKAWFLLSPPWELPRKIIEKKNRISPPWVFHSGIWQLSGSWSPFLLSKLSGGWDFVYCPCFSHSNGNEKWKCELLSRVRLLSTPWTVACQAPLSTEFFRQEYWSELPFPSLGDLSNPRIKPGFPHCRQILHHLSPHGSPSNGSG